MDSLGDRRRPVRAHGLYSVVHPQSYGALALVDHVHIKQVQSIQTCKKEIVIAEEYDVYNTAVHRYSVYMFE